VPQGLFPQPASAGTGLSQSFTVSPGFQYPTETDFLVSTSTSGSPACLVKYVSYSFYLANDAGGWLGPMQNGIALQNNECLLGMNGSGPVDSVGNPIFAIAFKSGISGQQNLYVKGYNSGGNNGWNNVGTWNISPIASAPTNASSITGSGGSYTFTFGADSVNGSPFINATEILFNYGVDAAGACYLYVSPASNTIYLSNDNGVGWVGSGTIGTTGTLSNSQCQLNLGQSSVTRWYPADLGLSLALTFKAGLPGPQNVYQLTCDNSGLCSNWQQVGTWTTSTVSSQPPSPVSALPTSGTGLAQNFRFTASSPNGYGYIAIMEAIVGSSLTWTSACGALYYPLDNTVYLANDAGTGWIGGPLGATGTFSNSQCTLNTGTSSVSGSGNNLTVSLTLTFNSSWAGAKNTWLWVYDRGDHSAGFQQMSTWTVGTPPPPTVTSFSPTSGTGLGQTFVATYSDLQWSQDISEVDFLVNSSTNTNAACYVKWTPSGNGFYLMNDAGNAWLGPVAGGSNSTVQNSRCILNGATSSSTTTETTVTLNFGLTFLQAFNGGQNLYTTAIGSGGNAGLQTKGTWIVEPADPTPDTVGDPRRIGVHPTGSYWGAAGEQIDLLSGNLNVTIPLLKPLSRGGWGVNFALSYNSQLWREDSTGTTIEIPDVGYGLGWRLQAGSLLPVYAGNPSQLNHFVYSDATGAQYRLDQNTGNVWTSLEGVYVSYDANATRLYSPDGTFWVMGAQSSAGEPDAGTLYPTLMEDTNGNQITIQYASGSGSQSANTSGRISMISDPRGVWIASCGCYETYGFTYNTDSPPHLTAITTYVGDNASHTFHYLSGQSLTSPFPPNQSFDTTTLLQSVSILDQIESFQYGTGSGELTEMITPFGGNLQWQYITYNYGSSVSYRQVQTRLMTPSSGANPFTWSITINSNTTPPTTTVVDVGASKSKAWTFQSGGTFAGLVTTYEERGTQGNALLHKDYTWAQDTASNIYVGTVQTTLNPNTSSSVVTKSDQTLDSYGNVQVSHVYDYGNLSSPMWTYNYAYLTDPNYISRYIRNRMISVTVQKGSGSQSYLQYNAYDGGTGLTDHPGLTFHDSSYGTSFHYRGNVNENQSMGVTTDYSYEISGVPIYVSNSSGQSANLTLSSSTNYSLPGVLTPNGNSNLATTITYASSFAVSSLVGPNGAGTSTTYDWLGRPASTTVADGATTYYSYSGNTQTATLTDGSHNRWQTTAVDGFGRTTRVQTGYDTTTVSTVDTQYAPCACSPLGKMSQVSQPYAPGATPVWTAYTHDGRGRTLTATGPDGSVTSYSYSGNQTTVTDPTGKWKTNIVDALGNLISVTEPNPAGGANIVTTYTYDQFNHLTNVTGAQARTFVWTPNGDLYTATNPENGTVTYAYTIPHQLSTRTDAKGQQTKYTYDGYGRLSQVQHLLSNGQEDPNQRWTYYYDGNTSDTTFTAQNGWGRLTEVAFGSDGVLAGNYLYSYNTAGRVTTQRLQVPMPPNQTPFNFDATYAWDNEGRMTSLGYPVSGPVYAFGFDSMGRLSTMQENGTQMATAGYNWASQMTSLAYDTLSESRTYDPVTLQLKRILTTNGGGSVMDMTYNYAAGQNNGRITSSTDGVLGETVNYTYDSLNRLSTAQATNNAWGQSFSFDVNGNLTGATVTAGSAPHFSTSFDGSNHQSGTTYDANGNPIGWPNPPSSNSSAMYDVENRLVEETISGGQNNYSYDPSGKRVMQWTNVTGSGPIQVSFYAITGQRLATYQLATGPTFTLVSRNLYFGGRLIRSAGDTVAMDRLGSVRARVTTNGGSLQQMSYWPYGGERTSTADGIEKFGTYFRDMPGQDYADQRYFNGTIGRFWTPDPSGLKAADSNNPSTWNMYSYTHGDPVNRHDQTGTDDFTGTDDSGLCELDWYLDGTAPLWCSSPIAGCGSVTIGEMQLNPVVGTACLAILPPILLAAQQAAPPPVWEIDVGFTPVFSFGRTQYDHLFIWVHQAGTNSFSSTLTAGNSIVYDGGPSGTCPFGCGYVDTWKSVTGHYGEISDPQMVDFFSEQLFGAQLAELSRDFAALAYSLNIGNVREYQLVNGPNSNSVAYTLLLDAGIGIPQISMTTQLGVAVGTLSLNGVSQYFTGWGQYLGH
jgi:RHS repeat-associated protein